MTNPFLWPGLPAAVLAALALGASKALQHHATRTSPLGGLGALAAARAVAAHPLWLGSVVANAGGIVLQWLALSSAPLAVVQPVLVLGLVFAVLVSGLIDRRRPDRVVAAGTVLCTAGLGAFLSFARPVRGDDELTDGELATAGSALAVILLCCLAVAARSSRTSRTLGLATATGVLFGVTAGLAKLAVADLRTGLGGALTHWAFYAAATTGVLGFVLSQYAFRASGVLAPALAVMVALDPVVGIAVGTLWLGERIESGPIAVGGQIVALSIVLIGVAILARRISAR